MAIHKIRVPESFCRTCGHQLDAATGTAKQPVPGSVSICIECAEISVFTDEMTLRPPTEEEKLQFATDERIIKAQIVIRGMSDVIRRRFNERT